MKGSAWLGLLLGGGLLAYLLYSRQQSSGAVGGAVSSGLDTVETAAQSGVEDVKAALTGWQTVNQGPVWVPVIHAAESQWGIPTDLLARMAYQESRYRSEIIDGTKASPTGALGILQLEPMFGNQPGFATVRVPIPFTQDDTNAQIQEAAQELVRLYNYFRDWGLAIAGYNDGQGNVSKYLAGTHTLPDETLNYVTQVLTDVPIPGATIPA